MYSRGIVVDVGRQVVQLRQPLYSQDQDRVVDESESCCSRRDVKSAPPKKVTSKIKPHGNLDEGRDKSAVERY